MQTFAMWSGVVGIAVSLFAVIILFLTRKNILDILDKDVILFDKNFELKKKAIEDAFKMLDELKLNPELKNDPRFKERAMECYNNLLCVVTCLKLVDDFYSIVFEAGAVIEAKIVQFKLACRRDIGLSTKHSKAFKQIKNNVSNNNGAKLKNNTQPSQPGYNVQQSTVPAETVPSTQNVQPQVNEEPVMRTAQPVRPVAPIQADGNLAQAPNPARVQRPMRPAQNPTPVRPAVRPVGRPPVTRPIPPTEDK